MAYKLNAITGELDLVESGGSAGEVNSLAGNTGSATPVAGVISVIGNNSQGLTSSGSGSTLTFTAFDADTSQKGVTELATSAETITGSDATRSVTPSGLGAKLGDQTQYAVPYGTGTSNPISWTSALTNGQLLIGSSGSAPVAASLTAGVGITITPGAGSVTVSASAQTLPWISFSSTTNAEVNTGYIADAGTPTLYLPQFCEKGDIIIILQSGATSISVINQYQSIRFGNGISTSGLATTGTGDCLTLRCTVQDDEWEVLGPVGTWTDGIF